MEANFQGFWGDKTFFRPALSAADFVGLQKHKEAVPKHVGAWPSA